MLNALTIDVEEHFQVHAFETVIARSSWDHYPSRVVPNTERVLDILREYKVRATFFVLGWVADRYPQLVERIAAEEHEIATHGYWHELVYRQTPELFRADLCRSIDAIGRVIDREALAGYRAPAFSITEQSLWALDVLYEQGLCYDSSIFPLAMHDRYGISGANRFANKVHKNLWEFPVSTVRLVNQNVPVAGGGYFRLFPQGITQAAIRHLNAQAQPAVVYLHPWEFDPEQPRIAGAPLISKFRHYVNLGRTEPRLRSLLETFPFAPIQEVFARHLQTPVSEPHLAAPLSISGGQHAAA